MRKLSLIFVLSFFVAVNCVSSTLKYSTYYYDIKLVKPTSSDVMFYSDDIIDVSFHTEDLLYIEIYNKTDTSIKILWDESSLIYENESFPVIHSDVKFVDMGKPQIPTLIPPKTKIKDVIVSKNSIKYYSDSGWGAEPIFSSFYSIDPERTKSQYDVRGSYVLKIRNAKEKIEQAKRLVGSEFGLFFTIAVSEEKKEYFFKFKILELLKNVAN